MFDPVVEGRYKVLNPLGKGAFGQIYDGVDIQTNEPVAIKFELMPVSAPNQITQLVAEARFYQILHGATGFSHMHYFGNQGSVKSLVLDLFGPSLGRLFEFKKRKFSLKTVLMLAEEMLLRVQFLHEKGIVHRDLKPDNFVVERGARGNIVFLIDFGVADKFRGSYKKQHVKYEENCEFVGSPMFASINFIQGQRYSRRDDIEALAYILIFFAKGSLPWEVQGKTFDELKSKILQIKCGMTSEEVCEGIPTEFREFLDEARALGFNERPKYRHYRDMFKNLFCKEGYVYDCEYDWSGGEVPHARGTLTSQMLAGMAATPHSK